jgi:hypothetical protein
MKTLTTLLALALFCATGYGQTIKALGYNTTNGEVVANTGTNVLTFTNSTVNMVGIGDSDAMIWDVLNNTFEIAVSLKDELLFIGTNAATAAAATRTNLGLGATWLTNTNVTNFRADIGLGATDDVQFKRITADFLQSTTTNAFIELDDDNFIIEAAQLEIRTPITFDNATNAAATRTNLSLPLPALTNTSNADMLSALGAAQTIAKWKSVAQSVTNSTTLIDDDTLFFATEANARYYVRLYLMAEGASGQTGTHSFVVTATNATVYGTWRATGGTFGTTPLTTETSFSLGAANPRAFYVNFTVEGGASPGEVKLQWAQGTASTNASSVSEGSVLIAEKLP